MSRKLLRATTTLRTPYSPAERSCLSSSSFRHFSALSRGLDADINYRVADLMAVLAKDANPNSIWGHYLNAAHTERLPPKIHQEVLRKCSPPPQEMRADTARLVLVKGLTRFPHRYEGRFQAIIRNMRAMGVTPTLDDYNFVLQQFAAVGHHMGVVVVLKEMRRAGHRANNKTYGLCLQAIAHRLTLPVALKDKTARIAQCNRLVMEILADMRSNGMQFTSVNFDLSVRIMKETLDMEAFESLWRWGYGIDLSYPDRLALEHAGSSSLEAAGLSEDSLPLLPKPLPFSTSALNTTLDILGRLGQISKMVQAFEVLTTPLPGLQQHFARSFDDEDDFGVSAEPPPPSPSYLPFAAPNTTSYNLLLRHLGRARHAVLSRHYMVQALYLERANHFKLSNLLRTALTYRYPSDEVVPTTHFAINRGHVISIMGESNRDKDLGLMTWMSSKMPRLLRMKQDYLAHYIKARNQFVERGKPIPTATKALYVVDSAEEAEASPPTESLSSEQPSSTPPASDLTAADSVESESTETSTPSPTPPSHAQPTRSSKTKDLNADAIFAADIENPDPVPTGEPFKPFDLDLHIRILRRDLLELTEVSERLEHLLGRTHQRIKERVGRRVWAGKDIYLRTDKHSRKVVDRAHWKRIVNFKPRREPRRAQNEEPWRETLPHLETPYQKPASVSSQPFRPSSFREMSTACELAGEGSFVATTDPLPPPHKTQTWSLYIRSLLLKT